MEWQEDAGVQQLEGRGEQPFYQVLVDWEDAFSDRSMFSGQSLIAYVAQDMLSAPEARTCLPYMSVCCIDAPYMLTLYAGQSIPSLARLGKILLILGIPPP